MLPVHKQVSLSNDPGPNVLFTRTRKRTEEQGQRTHAASNSLSLVFGREKASQAICPPGGVGSECFSKIAHFESMSRGPVSIIELIVLWCLGELAQIGGGTR